MDPAAEFTQEPGEGEQPDAGAEGAAEATVEPAHDRKRKREEKAKPATVADKAKADLGPFVVAYEMGIPINKLYLDTDMSRGQIRQVEDPRVRELYEAIILQPPAVPHRVLVWEGDVLGVLVLG